MYELHTCVQTFFRFDDGNPDSVSAEDPECAQKMWVLFKEAWCWVKKGDKVSLTRWFAFFKASIEFDKVYHRFLVGLFWPYNMPGRQNLCA